MKKKEIWHLHKLLAKGYDFTIKGMLSNKKYRQAQQNKHHKITIGSPRVNYPTKGSKCNFKKQVLDGWLVSIRNPKGNVRST